MNFREILFAIFIASTLSLGFIFTNNGNSYDIEKNDKEIIDTQRGIDPADILPPKKK